ncbi:MAG: hypothetical protein RIQ79_728, partial [Verrucomicrobiota bacterium]
MENFLIDVPVPSMGATVNELTVIDLKVGVGDVLSKGRVAAELESDKSVFEWEAPCDGTVRAVHCRAGDIIRSGDLFISIETADESLRHLISKGASVKAVIVAPAAAPTPAPVATSSASTPPPAAASAAGSGALWTPRALKLAQEAGLAPAALAGITGTAPGGRISGDDFTN